MDGVTTTKAGITDLCVELHSVLSKKYFRGARTVLTEENQVITKADRVKVIVKCRSCGQQFILRGTPDKNGHVETGFKMCLCNGTDVDTATLQGR